MRRLPARGTVLDDRGLSIEWFAFFGATTGARLLGWCALTALVMPRGETPSRALLLERAFGSVSTRYRNVRQLEAFSVHLNERGLRLADDPDPDPVAVRGLVRAVS